MHKHVLIVKRGCSVLANCIKSASARFCCQEAAKVVQKVINGIFNSAQSSEECLDGRKE